MKKNLFMVAAVALMAMVSCNKELTDIKTPEQNGDIVSFMAIVDGAELPEPEGKAVLGTSTNNKPQSMWEANDKIAIHNGENGFVFSTKDDKTAAALFTYSGQEEFTAPNGVVAVYPSEGYTADLTNRTITASIPTAQEGKANTYNPSAGLAVAYSTTDNLAFKNACALLKFTVNSDNVKSVTISGNNMEKISGEVKVTMNADGTVSKVESTSKSESYVKIWKYDNQLMKKGEVYYIAIIPQEFKYGLKAEVQLTNDAGANMRVKEIITDYTISRNEIVNLGKLTYSENAKLGTGWMLTGGYNGWTTSGNAAKFFYDIEGLYVVKNVKLMNTQSGQDAGFKVTFGTNDSWKGTSLTSNMSINKWNDLGGNNNIKVSENVAYDVYLTKDFEKIYITTTGSAAPTVPYCKLVVRVNKEITWYDKYIYAWPEGSTNNITAGWPGTKLNYMYEEGDYYVYYHEFDAKYNKTKMNFIINGGNNSPQTQDLYITLNGSLTTYDVHKGLVK